MKPQCVLFAMLVCLLASLTLGADTIYDDGRTHDISTMVYDGVLVYDSPDGLPTTVNLLTGNMQEKTGGRIQHGMDAYNFSKINLLGGWVDGSVCGHDSSDIEMAGGYVGGSIDAYDQTNITMIGGHAPGWVRVYNQSQAEIRGGTPNGLYVTDTGRSIVSGGGFFNEIWTDSYGYVHIMGGDIMKGLWVEGNGIAMITGGNFCRWIDGGKHLKVDQNGTIFISGTDFNYPYGEILDRSGTLTGTLANGTPIDDFFTISDYGRIVLIPEPCTLLLLGVGGMMIRKRK